jgi:hypothetical protein
MNKADTRINKIIAIFILIAIVSLVFIFLYKNDHSDILSKTKLMDVPYSVKCFFKEPGCEEGNIDGWSIVYLLFFFIMGLIIPKKYVLVFLITIAVEIFKPCIGGRSKYIINPIIGMTGYAIGSLLRINQNNYHEKYQVLVD